MAAIPGYERVVIKQAPVADTVTPGAISGAAGGFNALAQVADVGVQVQQSIQAEDDKATFNEMIITREREKIDRREAAKKTHETTPDGFAVFMEKEQQKIDAATIKALPQRLQQSYKEATMRANVVDYEQDRRWETERKIAVVGDKIGRAGEEIINLGYVYGASGKSFDELTPNIDATYVAGSGTLDPIVLSDFDRKLRSGAAQQYLAGLATSDPQAAQDLLLSGKFAKFLAPEEARKAAADIYYAMPDADKLEQISPDPIDAEALSLDVILASEGTADVQDGNGSRSVYGILKSSHPKEYAEALNLQKTRGVDAGKQYAREFYKREYYDANGIGELRPEVQPIVADGVVNHHGGFQKELVAAAKSGASPNELIEMRRAEYTRLRDTGKPQYVNAYQGWMNRLDKLPRGGESVFNLLSAKDKAKELDKLSQYQEARNVALAVRGEAVIDPASKIQRDAMDGYYNGTGAQQLLEQQNPDAAAYLGKFAKQYGLVPETAQRTLRGLMTSGQPEQKQYAYGVIGEIQKSNPSALAMAGGFTKKEIQDAGVFNGLIRSGASARFATDAITQAAQPMTADIRKQRQTEADKLAADKTASSIESVFDVSALPFTAPSYASAAQRDLIAGDYRRIYSEAFLQYGDKEMAKNAAETAIKVTSGVSKIGGKTAVMKYPPEMYYGVDGVEPDDISEAFTQQVKDDLKTLGYDDRLDFTLQPTVNAETAVNNGRKPAYNIWITGENGVVDLVRGENNMPVAFAFDQAPLLVLKNETEAQYNKRAQFRQRNVELWRGQESRRPLKDIMQ
jgi:hypothetical protein